MKGRVIILDHIPLDEVLSKYTTIVFSIRKITFDELARELSRCKEHDTIEVHMDDPEVDKLLDNVRARVIHSTKYNPEINDRIFIIYNNMILSMGMLVLV